MGEILYYIFIFPLESLLSFCLNSLHSFTHSYGLSIILLSLLVNLVLLKLTHIGEAKATKVSTLKSICDAKISEFKRVFKGAELQSYINTLYDQKHYHPIYALSGLSGLALQVPFFIAVLFLLQDFEGIKGVGFFGISDLSLPDGLLFGLNILPFIMCILSLVNVTLSVKIPNESYQASIAKNRSAFTQGVIISLIFLALLYQMPSALVLYWSTNVVFSLIRSLWGDSLLSMQFRRFWNFLGFANDNFSLNPQNEVPLKNSKKLDFFILRKPLKIAIIALSAIMAIGLCITFALMLYSKDNMQTGNLILKEPGTAQIHFAKWDFLLRSKSIANIESANVEWDKSIDTSHIKIFSVVNRYVEFGGSKTVVNRGDYMGQISYTMNFMPLLKSLFKCYFGILGVVFGIYLLFCLVMRFQAYSESNAKIYRNTTIYATVCIAFLICVFTPYQLYSTDITQFDSSQTYATLSALFGAFLLISFVVIYSTSFIPKRFSNIVAFILSLTLLIGLVYSFILVGDYGAMDRFILEYPPPNVENKIKQIIEFAIVLILGIALVIFTLKKLKIVLQITLATLFIISSINTTKIIAKHTEFTKTTQAIQSDKSKNPYEYELFSYSKTDKNIVVLVLDMFSGSHMPYILEQFPQFKTQLDGFILFDNAISSSNGTVYSMPSISGGEYYTIHNMNRRGDNRTQSIRNSYKSIGLSFANAGYMVGYYLMLKIQGRSELLEESKIFWLDKNESFESYFLENHPHLNVDEDFSISKILSFGLFKFVPELLKGKIYNGGFWLQQYTIDNRSIINNIASFYAPTHIGNTNATKPTFKFIHSLMTHFPFGIHYNNEQCNYLSDGSILKKLYEQDRYSYQHLDTEICAISFIIHYIQWLKNEGIYDNTQIFIVSDHAGIDGINFLSPRKIGPDVLFLFKDFNTKGELKIDSRLMGNYDAASIFCENLPNGCPNVPKNILKNYPQNREIIHARPDGFNQYKPNQWIISKTYKVKGNIYEPENWIDISNEIQNIK